MSKKHISLKKYTKLSKTKSCDSEFRIFILTQKFWASVVILFSEIQSKAMHANDSKKTSLVEHWLHPLVHALYYTYFLFLHTDFILENNLRIRAYFDYPKLYVAIKSYHSGLAWPHLSPKFFPPGSFSSWFFLPDKNSPWIKSS